MRRANNPSTSGSNPQSNDPSSEKKNMDDHEILEDQMERVAEVLKEKIGTLKSLTIDIGNEVRYQERLLRGIDNNMDRTHGFLGTTMNQVPRLSDQAPTRQMCCMIIFIVIVSLLIYTIIKWK